LFGTGIRNSGNRERVTALIDGGVSESVAYAGAQGSYDGLDQVNVVLPRGLPPGDLRLRLWVNGVYSNTVTLTIR
jgi:uncharacterized protein (TIGR03437 family)